MGIYAGQGNLILAFDPGRDKTGFAVVRESCELLFSGIFPSDERERFFDMLTRSDVGEFVIERRAEDFDFMSDVRFIAIGDGTHSKEFRSYVGRRLPLEIKITDERNTTLEARKLYWRLHSPGLLARLLPEGLRVPPRVLDDLAAWAIALRALA